MLPASLKDNSSFITSKKIRKCLSFFLFMRGKDGSRITVAAIIIFHHSSQRRTKAIPFIVFLPNFVFSLKAKCKLTYSKAEYNEILFSATCRT